MRACDRSLDLRLGVGLDARNFGFENAHRFRFTGKARFIDRRPARCVGFGSDSRDLRFARTHHFQLGRRARVLDGRPHSIGLGLDPDDRGFCFSRPRFGGFRRLLRLFDRGGE